VPRFFLSLFTLITAGFILASPVLGQNEFSGANCANYYCPVLGTTVDGNFVPIAPNPVGNCAANPDSGVVLQADGNFVCEYPEPIGTRVAIPRPPQLRVIEYWFLKIVYSAWALAGIYFTFVLIYIGFLYITSFGNEFAVADVIKRFRNWMIGMALVFLSYPVLVTFFNVLPIDRSQNCYTNVQQGVIGFQFFFPNLCGSVNGPNSEACRICTGQGVSLDDCGAICR
jgi:hypothetical protein